MGRGLSDLQRWIVCRTAEKPDDNCMMLVRVIVEFFGIEPRPIKTWSTKARREDGTYPPHALHGQMFRGNAKEAATARASICRAVKRLEQRGLVDVRSGTYGKWCGLRLTAKGEEFVLKTFPLQCKVSRRRADQPPVQQPHRWTAIEPLPVIRTGGLIAVNY